MSSFRICCFVQVGINEGTKTSRCLFIRYERESNDAEEEEEQVSVVGNYGMDDKQRSAGITRLQLSAILPTRPIHCHHQFTGKRWKLFTCILCTPLVGSHYVRMS